MGKWIGILPSTDAKKHILIDEMDKRIKDLEESD